MKEWFGKLNIYYKCCILSAIFLILFSLLLIPLYFFNYAEIPLGLALGLGYGSIIYLIFGYLEDKKKEGYFFMIVVSSLRYFVFAIVLILLALCYYIWDIRYFNLISYVGGYVVTTVIFAILFYKTNKKDNN